MKIGALSRARASKKLSRIDLVMLRRWLLGRSFFYSILALGSFRVPTTNVLGLPLPSDPFPNNIGCAAVLARNSNRFFFLQFFCYAVGDSERVIDEGIAYVTKRIAQCEGTITKMEGEISEEKRKDTVKEIKKGAESNR